MRAGGLGGLLTLVTALFLRNPSSARSSDIPPLKNVNVSCDNYGVVVNWNTSHRQGSSILTLKRDPGQPINIPTRNTRYNISKYLQDHGFTIYMVEVKTEDGKIEYSPCFSYNKKLTVGLKCNLTFPEVELIPGDHQLNVRFRNPLRLYRDSPALRNLQSKDSLRFSVYSTKMDLPDTMECPEKPFECSQKKDFCEGNISFPEEQEEYCIVVSGCIRQTYVQRTEPVCYRGSLKPSIPITTYIIPACVLLGIILISMAMIFLAKKINKTIKENIHSKIPDFLKETSYTHPFTALREGNELLERNPLVEPVTLIPITTDLPANNCHPWGSVDHLEDLGDDPGEKSICGELEAKVVQEVAEYEHEEHVPGGGYDMPHGLLNRAVEFSPEDIVNTYG